MSLTLQFGNDALGAVSTLAVNREGPAPDTVEQWKATIEIEAATPGTLEARLQLLRDAQGTTGDLKLLHGGTEVRSLAVADARRGPTLTASEAHDTAPGQAHNRRRVTLTFRATVQDAAPVQSHEFTIRETSEPGRPVRLTTSGLAVFRRGEDPSDHEDTLLPATGGGYRRVRRDVTRDANAPSIKYVTVDEQVFSALPGGVEDGHYVVTEARGGDGQAVRVTSGFFVGAGAHARALELRPGDESLLDSRVSQNPFARRVDFEFREQLPDDSHGTLTESLTFTTTRRVVDHPLLDRGLPAWRQQVGAPQTEVVQEGSAIGQGRHAAPPAPRFPTDVVERRVRYSLPHPGLPSDRRWVTTWRYVSRSTGRIVESTPGV